jgi:hypothetical protein
MDTGTSRYKKPGIIGNIELRKNKQTNKPRRGDGHGSHVHDPNTREAGTGVSDYTLNAADL